MTKEQIGWLLLVAGLAQITVLLVGDIITLVESHGHMDSAFLGGMAMHYSAVCSGFAGGKFLRQIGSKAVDLVSDQKRAELNERVGV